MAGTGAGVAPSRRSAGCRKAALRSLGFVLQVTRVPLKLSLVERSDWPCLPWAWQEESWRLRDSTGNVQWSRWRVVRVTVCSSRWWGGRSGCPDFWECPLACCPGLGCQVVVNASFSGPLAQRLAGPRRGAASEFAFPQEWLAAWPRP